MKTRHILILVLTFLLAAGSLACGGGGKSNPVNPGPNNQNNGGGNNLTGRILDREGTPQGAPWATVKLTVQGGGEIAPTQVPQSGGTDPGKFEFIGLPIGIPMTLEISLFQVSIGRNLGWIQTITLNQGGTHNLGDIVLENDFIDNGWTAYGAKDYTHALINFNRAFQDRFIQADALTRSSSAYTGIGWVYAKRGKDNQTGLHFVDDSGNFLDTINSYEWDQALLNFDRAIANPNDADAFLGQGGTFLTLIGQASKDPVLIGPEIPFYAFVDFYFDEAQTSLEKALSIQPDLQCSHDEISADDVRATLLFLNWIGSHQVSPESVTSLSNTGELNQGSKQLLSVLPDLINYNPYPQL